jgi:AcrR family transcriptional regulator
MASVETSTNGQLTRREATAQRRREILRAALELFLRQGVEATTMEQIRDASGASVGSIYHLFRGKHELAHTLFVEGMRGYHDRVLAAVRRQRTARGRIRAVVATHLQVTVEQPELALYLTRLAMAETEQEIANESLHAYQSFCQDLYACLRPHIERGELEDLPSELYFSLLVGPASHLARAWLRGRYRHDPLQAVETLARAAWQSLLPAQPRRMRPRSRRKENAA